MLHLDVVTDTTFSWFYYPLLESCHDNCCSLRCKSRSVSKSIMQYPTRCGRLLPFHSNWDTQVWFVLQVQSTSFNAKSG
ncbi:hypothetical protein HanPI659440_Chr10g0384351 [Helianthus annuus]|nr:hypothetical protein HanPI659440_Chr10g0384351 [Helianthus annuus]